MEVTIRPLEVNDALISYRWRNNPEIWEYTRNKPNIVVTPEIEFEWIKKVISNNDERRYAIIADGNYVGNTYLTNIKNNTASFHIFIGDKNYWGKGIARCAVNCLFEKCKAELNIKTINLNVHPENLRAVSLYNSLGFINNGIDLATSRLKMIKNL